MIIKQGVEQASHEELVFFAFDEYAIPFQHGLKLQLVSFGQDHSTLSNIVVGLGAPGAPDSHIVTYYGTVHRVGEALWMWYLGQGDDRWHERLCLAISQDGRNWEKPALGLVQYNGTKDNNLVDLMGGQHDVTACVVYHEPDDPDPARRFKMVFESLKYNRRMAVAYSPDGLRWRESPSNPVGPMLEPAGGTNFNGTYYVNGQGGRHWSAKGRARKLVTHVSYDFERWTQATCLGLRRDPLPPRPTEYGQISGPQVHLGAALWNRGNVLVGFYGMWNGHPSNDRRLTWMNLGLVVSNDCLHFREPIPDLPIVEAMEVGWTPTRLPDATVHFPALIQGQGFENVGDETLFWYSPWPEVDSDGVRLASWGRDRLGCLQPYVGPVDTPHLITTPIYLEGKSAQVSLNVDGLSQNAHITVSILDEQFREIEGYAAHECVGPTKAGLYELVTWRGTNTVDAPGSPIRIRVNFAGVRPEDIKLYAIYIKHATTKRK